LRETEEERTTGKEDINKETREINGEQKEKKGNVAERFV
jgi:hypothetical protein